MDAEDEGHVEATALGNPIFIVRDARLDELDEIAEVIHRAYEEYTPSPLPEPWKEAWEAYWRDIGNVRGRLDEAELVVAERAGKIVGAVTFYPDYARAMTSRGPEGWQASASSRCSRRPEASGLAGP